MNYPLDIQFYDDKPGQGIRIYIYNFLQTMGRSIFFYKNSLYIHSNSA